MKFRVTMKEVKLIVQWGLTGIGTFLIFEPIQEALSQAIAGGEIWSLLDKMFLADWKSMLIGVGITGLALWLFKVQ